MNIYDDEGKKIFKVTLIFISLILSLIVFFGFLSTLCDYIVPYMESHKDKVKTQSIIQNYRLLKEAGINKDINNIV